MDWKFCVLGTKAGGAPLIKKHSSATALLLPAETFLFDCGEYTQVQMLRAGVSRVGIQHLFLSHLHGDHVLGLIGLLSTMAGEGRSAPLHIYAPTNAGHSVEEWISLSVKLMDITLTFPIHYHVLPVGFSGEILRTKNAVVTAQMLEHRITSFGFRVEEIPRANIDLEKARDFGIEPSPMLGEIKRVGFVRLADEQIVYLDDIAAPPHKPRSFVYCGDTCVCDATVELAQNADVMLHEATFSDEMLDKAAERFHCTASQAASQAQLAGVGCLYLTHFSVRYKSLVSLLREARRIFPNTRLARECRVELIESMDSIAPAL
jgi:ribonuclease Z